MANHIQAKITNSKLITLVLFVFCTSIFISATQGQETVIAKTADPVTEQTVTGQEGETEVSKFAENVVLHVVLHELGHALVREFDLPILGNEETLADAFATCYLTAHMPDRALEVLTDRTKSLMFEANEILRNEWTVRGEHNSDARRAFQIAALAVAADKEKYLPVAKAAGMTDQDIRNAADYGTEIHRSWRRILQPLMMPTGSQSREARVRFDAEGELVKQLQASPMTQEIKTATKSFDWHSQVTVFFAEGDGGAGWSRARRTITVNSEYVERFIKQGASINK